MALVTSLIFFIITCSFTKLIAQSDQGNHGFVIGTRCLNFTSMEPHYDIKVQSLLSNLASKSFDSHSTSIPGFYNTTIGVAPNKLYGSYLCWGHLDPQVCHDCVSEVINKGILIYDDHYDHYECFGVAGFFNMDLCMVQYANHSTTYKSDGRQVFNPGTIGEQVSNYQQYNQTVSTTIEGLIREAAFGNWSTPNFETRIVNVVGSNDHEKIYTLVQCTPEISAMNCSSCLEDLYSAVPGCCNGTQGGAIVGPDCLLKYNNQSLFDGGGAYHSFMPSCVHVLMVLSSCFYFLFM